MQDERLASAIRLMRRYALVSALVGIMLYGSGAALLWRGAISSLEATPLLLLGEAAISAAVVLVILAAIWKRLQRQDQ